jgi:hypothetical protein
MTSVVGGDRVSRSLRQGKVAYAAEQNFLRARILQ